jgi:hypothetical protein
MLVGYLKIDGFEGLLDLIVGLLLCPGLVRSLLFLVAVRVDPSGKYTGDTEQAITTAEESVPTVSSVSMKIQFFRGQQALELQYPSQIGVYNAVVLINLP